MPRSLLPIVLITAALVVWLFGPALTGASSFGFRDAAHYYHPLFEYIRGEWGAGRLPLWNPYENCGTPLVAEATSSVFYPGKLWFALPLDYTWLYNQYLVLHVVLAAATSYRLARHLHAPPLGATLGAVSYAFGGYVLFQYGNAIFLVGAAWLPLALLYADRMLREGRRSSIVGFGASLAMIVLGGDPHLAYNVALAAAGYAVLLWRADRRRATQAGPLQHRPPRPRRMRLLASGLAIAALLSAVQILPTREAAPYGARAQFDAPRNLYELAGTLRESNTPSRTTLTGFLGGARSGHQSQIYGFSLEPWRAIELVWPNAAGRQFPTHRRWLNTLGAERNLWTPSLYLGLLPILLAMRQWSLRKSAALEVRGLSWLALLSVTGSLGAYGLGSLINFVTDDPQSFGIGPEFGGLYWLLTVVLPGYVQFRYPAKLLVLASLALSMLAARQWRHSWNAPRSMTLLLAAIPLLSVAAAVLAIGNRNFLQAQFTQFPPNPFLGPFDSAGAWNDLFDGLLHATLLSAALLMVYRIAAQRPRQRRTLQLAALAIVALDLGVAQHALIEWAPAELWRERLPLVDKLDLGNSYRLFRQRGPLPPSFAERRSEERYAESVRWDRETLYPKFPLPLHVPLVETAQNVAGYDYEVLLDVALTRNKRNHQVSIPDASILSLLAARTAITAPDASEQLANPRQLAEGLIIGQRPEALPRAWIVHDVELLGELTETSPRAIRQRTEQVCFPEGEPRNWRKQAVIEGDGLLASAFPQQSSTSEGESCMIRYADPLRVEIETRLLSTGVVVLSDQFFPGWRLTVESQGQRQAWPIYRTNRVMRGTVLPEGEHLLIYEYRPSSVYWGGAISALSLLGVGAWSVADRIRARRAQRPSSQQRGSQSPASVRAEVERRPAAKSGS